MQTTVSGSWRTRKILKLTRKQNEKLRKGKCIFTIRDGVGIEIKPYKIPAGLRKYTREELMAVAKALPRSGGK